MIEPIEVIDVDALIDGLTIFYDQNVKEITNEEYEQLQDEYSELAA